jgi:hypothetical protein
MRRVDENGGALSIARLLVRLLEGKEPIMQYMLLIYGEKSFANLSEPKRGKLMQEFGEFTQGIVKSGQFRAGAQLQPSSTATTVRVEDSRRITTDGPFAEAKEQLGGYYLVECDNLDQALAIAARIPSGPGGAIEVRPLVPTSQAARTPPAK